MFRDTDWRTVRLRPVTRETLERVAAAPLNAKIRYVVLFGSEARGEATLSSDVDLALVSDEPLTRAERLEFKRLVDGVSYPEFNVTCTRTEWLDTEKVLDVNYHIRRDGLVIYEG